MNKKLAAVGLSAGLVIGSGAGLILQSSGLAGAAPSVAAAVTTPVDTANTTDTAADTATRPDHAARLQEVLQPLVDDNTITQAQADAVIAALEAARPEGGRGGHGHGGPGGRGGRGAHLETVATVLGISVEDLRTGLVDGQTIAEIATANGKTAEEVVDALVAEATERIGQAVTDGKLTQEEADVKLAELDTKLTEFVNSTPELRGPRGQAPASTDANG
jgi:hypothetical protein